MCAGCQRLKVAKHMRRIDYGLSTDAGDRRQFLTLTSRPGVTWPQIMRAWSSLVKQIRRWAPGVQYMVAKEEGSLNGAKHLHILFIRWRFIPIHWISQAWDSRGIGQVVKIRKIVPALGSVASYVCKYVSKGIGSFDVQRHVTYSLGWPKAPKPSFKVVETSPIVPMLKGDRVLPSGSILPLSQPDLVEDCDCFSYALVSTRVGLESDASPPKTSTALPVLPNVIAGQLVEVH